MPETCPTCGASLPDGNDCQSLFDSFLALEFTDPAYGQVHFLTVACYMIQHNRYSDEALLWMAEKLRAHLEDGLPVQLIRQQASQESAPDRRNWKIPRPAGAPPPPKVDWQMTIADVAANYRDAASYCDLVRQWVGSILQTLRTTS